MNTILRTALASVVLGTLLIGLSAWWLVSTANFYASQILVLKEFTAEQKHKLLLFELVDYDYRKFKLLARIIQCESSWKANAQSPTNDSGYLQINEMHRRTAEILGYDISSPEDNLRYGVILFKLYSTRPWSASRRCWSR